MLAKVYWKITSQQDSLLVSTLKKKYFPNRGFLKAIKWSKPSYFWTSFIWGRDRFIKGFGWRIHSETLVKVWEDNWIPSKSFFKSYCNNSLQHPNLLVADLIVQQSYTWSMSIVQQVYHPVDMTELHPFHPTIRSSSDQPAWSPHKKGKF